MATSIDVVIDNMRSSGGSEAVSESFFDQPFISFGFGDDVSPQEANFAKAAITLWAELIDVPIFFSNTSPNITFRYGFDIALDGGGQNSFDPLFSLTHHTTVSISRSVFQVINSVGLGDQEFHTFLHEIGHALGLTHPGPYNGSGTYGVDNVYPEDSLQYTVMSYFGEQETGAEFGGHSVTPMLHDIAAIQAIYGANDATRAGDTVYGFGSNNLHSIGNFSFDPYDFATLTHPAFSIWDGGGIDTIDASLFETAANGNIEGVAGRFPNQIIDLRAGAFSSIGFAPGFGHSVEEGAGSLVALVDNISIAYGVVIENAFGGGGDDTITGNNAGNWLVGNGGADHLVGGDGDDILEGGDGGDFLSGGSGNDILFGGTGADELDGGAGYDTASYANATKGIVRNPSATSGITLDGDVLRDTFISIEAYELTRFPDIFEAFDTNDSIFGGDGADKIFGLKGDDYIEGGDGDDTLDGGDGDDNLQGGIGNDTLLGGKGNDILFGGFGADTMTGGAGDDTYNVDNVGDIVVESLFAPLGSTPGIDTVQSSIDYILPNGVENLTLSGFAQLKGTGNSAANSIVGNAVANILDGAGGADHLAGRGGNDTYIVDNVLDVVDETGGGSADIDIVMSSVSFSLASAAQTIGAVENLTLTGSGVIDGTGNNFANIIIGNSASNTLIGNGGNDTLDGGANGDTMVGGTGNDTYIVDNTGDRVDESTGSLLDIDTVQSSVTFSLLNTSQALGNIENVTLTGRGVINATGNSLDNVLIGNSASNTLTGGVGNDTLIGAGGNDTLIGGANNDTYSFSGLFGSDTINDVSGTDKILFTDAAVLVGAVRTGNDLVATFSTGTIRITNHFTTGQVETLQIGGKSFVLANGMIGGDASGIISGTKQGELIDGRGGDDILYGNGGGDVLLGGGGDDLLDGGHGRDRIDGGIGDDLLTGGKGADTFVFQRGYGHDTITDFSIFEDRLEFSGFNSRPIMSLSSTGVDLLFGDGDILSLVVDNPMAFIRHGDLLHC